MNLSYTLARTTGNTTDAFVDTYSATNGYQDPYKYKYYSKFPEAGYVPQLVKGFVVLPSFRSAAAGDISTRAAWRMCSSEGGSPE